MKQLRYCVPFAFAAALLVVPARSCGPDFPEAIFVLPNGPGGDYTLFTAGRLGVPQPEYRTRHLVIAYDYLTQRRLAAGEQKQAVDVDRRFTDGWSYDDSKSKATPVTGLSTWLAARAAFGPVDKYTPDDKLETDIYANYSSTPNCLDDAFGNAARTLAARAAAYGKQDASVVDWVRGQDAVFKNCDGGKVRELYGQPKPAPPDPVERMPKTLSNAPVWLQQDRAYQLAAAKFYATDYDGAIAGFRAIAADPGTPWSSISRYLVARALIRKATMQDEELTNPSGDAAKQAAATTALHDGLAKAQHELLAMQKEPRMATLRAAVEALLDYVSLRVDPDGQAVVLADRLHGVPTDRFGQALVDLTYLRTNPTDASLPPSPHTPAPGTNDMLAWIDAVSTSDKTVAIARWRDTHATVWLLAAMMTTETTDPAKAELIRAAQAVPKTDPGYVAVTYHRLRLMPRDAVTREELLGVMPDIERGQTISTVNLYTALNAESAPTLEAWLATAGRRPAGESSWGELSDGMTESEFTTNNGLDNTNAHLQASSPEDICGLKIQPKTTKLFDKDAAVALNHDMPLRLLATAAESSSLPANLRFQVAQAAWARAVLLKQPAIAARMTPLLVQCRAAWKPVLAAYDNSTTADDREANGLLALMRFASTEPSVREGEERRGGFATYDEFRQNWWCSTVPAAGDTVDTDVAFMERLNRDNEAGKKQIAAPPAPLFLTTTDRDEAAREVGELKKIPRASGYLGNAALAWYRAHPKDARTPDILGDADRVVRNSCRNDPPYDEKTGKQTVTPGDMTLTANLAHAIFDALHRDYPQSAWAKRYKSWE